ncbi:MAG TPA: hypothetical protein VM889_14605 [Candidatus Thermoplasmatota archaeon]|nr:hypothetical protein [Candidatus Thermoplasmatota archaeon]
MRAPASPAVLLLALAVAGCVASAPAPGGPPDRIVVERIALSSHFPTAGEAVGVEVVLANNGSVPGRRTLEVRVDGAALDRAEVTLAPGERRGIGFVLALAEPGPHVIEIAGARFEVVVASPVGAVSGPSPPAGPAALAA